MKGKICFCQFQDSIREQDPHCAWSHIVRPVLSRSPPVLIYEAKWPTSLVGQVCLKLMFSSHALTNEFPVMMITPWAVKWLPWAGRPDQASQLCIALLLWEFTWGDVTQHCAGSFPSTSRTFLTSSIVFFFSLKPQLRSQGFSFSRL